MKWLSLEKQFDLIENFVATEDLNLIKTMKCRNYEILFSPVHAN